SPGTDFELVGVHDIYNYPFLTAICPYRPYILICLAVSGQGDHGLSIPVVCTYRRSSDPVGCSIVRLVVDQYITDVGLAKIENIGVVLRQGSERRQLLTDGLTAYLVRYRTVITSIWE